MREEGEETVGKLPDWKGSEARRLKGLEGGALPRDTTYSVEDLKSLVQRSIC